MTKTKKRKCYICKEEHESSFVTFLDNCFQSICNDCGDGITIGIGNLAKVGVKKQSDTKHTR